MAESVPPGRAGRLWLRARVASAQRSLDLLERKRRLLVSQLDGPAQQRDLARRDWTEACRDAQTWGLRAASLGGASDISFVVAGSRERASVEVPWCNTMGVIHPGQPTCTLPPLAPAVSAAASAAIGPAAASYSRAVEAAVAYAAAERSFQMLRAELRATERRRRAIERRRLPALQEGLRRLELRLDELEREQRVIGRWVKRRSG